MNKMSGLITAALAATLATPAFAADVGFVPQSDTTGQVFSTNDNDGYSGGRGVVFAPTANRILTNVALYEDLSNVTLNYTLSLASRSTGQVDGGAVLASGSQTFTTSGLQFVDFALTPQALTAGTYYYLNFSFDDNSNQNFFYIESFGSSGQAHNQAGFVGIDATQSGNTANFVAPRIRLSFADAAVAPAVPEPATWAMMILGMGAIGFAMRRRKVATRVSYAA